MNTDSLRYLVIIVSIIGILLLTLQIYFYNPPEIRLVNNNTDYLDKVVTIKGIIKDVELKDNILFFKVCEYSRCLDCVIFNTSKNQTNNINSFTNSKNQIKLTGKYTLYNEKPELIVYNID